MPEINGILIFIVGGLVGGIIGFAISRMTLSSKQKAAQQEALDSSKAELDQYKSQVSNHFDNSAKLMGEVASSYQALYTHMAGQSATLLDPTDAEVPFPQLKTPPVKEQEDDALAQEVAEELLAARETAQESTEESPLAKETAQETTQETAEESLTAKEETQESTEEPLAAKEAAQESAEEPLEAKKAEQDVPESDDVEDIRDKKDKK